MMNESLLDILMRNDVKYTKAVLPNTEIDPGDEFDLIFSKLSRARYHRQAELLSLELARRQLKDAVNAITSYVDQMDSQEDSSTCLNSLNRLVPSKIKLFDRSLEWAIKFEPIGISELMTWVELKEIIAGASCELSEGRLNESIEILESEIRRIKVRLNNTSSDAAKELLENRIDYLSRLGIILDDALVERFS